MNNMKLLTAYTLTALLVASSFPAALEAGHSKQTRGTIVETAVAAGNFTTLVAALQASGLDGALSGEGPFTVFAPTDEAFSSLFAATGLTPEELLASPDLPKILKYHVLAGKVYTYNFLKEKDAETLAGETVVLSIGRPMPRRGLTYSVNDAMIVARNIRTSNGVIHAIDKVLLPPKDIVETAEAAGDFSILIAALKAAGLEEALKGEGPFTVFAPTDAAFGALLAKLDVTAEELLADPELASILLYHVVGGELYERDLRCTRSAETLQGDEVRFSSRGPWFMPLKNVYVNGVRVAASNVLASNGVIHVIDAVLLPPQE